MRSSDCGIHLSTVNPLPCSRNQSLLEAAIQLLQHCDHKDGHGQQQYSGRLWHLNNAHFVLKAPKYGNKISHIITAAQQHEPLIQGKMLVSCCLRQILTVTTNVIAERLIRPGNSFPNLLLYNFGFQNVPVLR